MKQLIILSRVLVGIVFVFSGFVKAVDPLGSAYKFGDYFNAFGMNFLNFLTLPLAVFLSSAELTIGVALLICYRMKVFSWIVLVFMSFFTVLTFFLAIYEPVTDCGCFGDALVITNWETFWKNIVIMGFTLVIFIHRRYFLSIRGVVSEWLVIAFVFLAVSWLSVHSINHLPPLDFRPYSIGSNIPYKMEIPPDAPQDVYETTLIYRNKKTGRNEEFSMENFPKDTLLYSFVDSQSKLITKGYEPPIRDFSVNSLDGIDVTDVILKDDGYSFLLISHDLSHANETGLRTAELLARFSRLSDNMNFYGITASSGNNIDSTRENIKLSFEFYHADEITLKTIVRSNPGLVLLKNGTVIGKWHYNDFPAPGFMDENFREITDNYPFFPGTNLSFINTPPPGAGSDTYETILYYKNVLNDSIAAFTIEDFPRTPEWLFEQSQSKLIKKGFVPPLSGFSPLTPEGNDLSGDILNSRENVFVLLVNDPRTVEPELLNRVNNLSVTTSGINDEKYSFYGLTGLSREELVKFSDSFVTPIQLASLEGDYIKRIAGDGMALVWIRNGIVMALRKDKDIPLPEKLSEFLTSFQDPVDADNLILPYLMDSYRQKWEKRFVYIFLFSLISLGLILRVYFEGRKKEIR